MQANQTQSGGATGEKAGFWIRVGAYLIDAVILIVINFIVGLILGLVGLGKTAVPSAVGFIIGIAYFVYLWSASGGGQTIGQRALGLRVIKTDGTQLDFGRSLLRYVGLIIASIPIGLGLAWVGWDPQKQGWHDKIAGTYVVKRA
jgi:uncharacterized RDD family membrane protein YckC